MWGAARFALRQPRCLQFCASRLARLSQCHTIFLPWILLQQAGVLSLPAHALQFSTWDKQQAFLRLTEPLATSQRPGSHSLLSSCWMQSIHSALPLLVAGGLQSLSGNAMPQATSLITSIGQLLWPAALHQTRRNPFPAALQEMECTVTWHPLLLLRSTCGQNLCTCSCLQCAG